MRLHNEDGQPFAQYDNFVSQLETLEQTLSPMNHGEDLKKIVQLRENFNRKIQDFFRENRKLNIGVVGQVKAGKSSFLNTLLFDGQEILPKASTPKTATLTKMEYAEENVIEIEYYTTEEWEVLEDNAQLEDEDEVVVSARELMSMVERSGLQPHSYLERGTDRISFESYDALINQLNDYVGENGKYTPIVKAVTLYLQKEEFRGLSIVDTPGLNDPIVSRTIRTKEFIEVCDVVFFLSQTGSFLDVSDWGLLSAQLPQKGVKRLTLIASKYDSGLRDVLRVVKQESPFAKTSKNTASNIPDGCKLISDKLRKRAKEKVKEFVADLTARDCDSGLIHVIEQCKNPLMVSVMAHNMIGKAVEDYTPEEKNVYQALSKFSSDIQSDLALVGNLDAVRQVFQEVVAEKEAILEEKSASFIPTALEELTAELQRFKEKATQRALILEQGDRAQLLEQKEAIGAQINHIKSDIAKNFNGWRADLNEEKAHSKQVLRKISSDHSNLESHTGTEEHTHYHTVYRHRFLFLKWGKEEREYTTTSSYSYMLASDAAEHLRDFARASSRAMESVFDEIVSPRKMQRQLLDVVVENFDLSSANYNSSFFRMVISEQLSNIEYPTLKIDASPIIQKVTSSFGGEIRSGQQDAFRRAFDSAMDQTLSLIAGQLDQAVSTLQNALGIIEDELKQSFLDNINQEFNALIAQFAEKEKELAALRSYIATLEGEQSKLKEKSL